MRAVLNVSLTTDGEITVIHPTPRGDDSGNFIATKQMKTKVIVGGKMVEAHATNIKEVESGKTVAIVMRKPNEPYLTMSIPVDTDNPVEADDSTYVFT